VTRISISSLQTLDKIHPVLAHASLFVGDFSIDWLQSLTGDKPSVILSTLEESAQRGWVKQKEPGVYAFVDPGVRERLLNLLSSEEQLRLHREISTLILRESTDADTKAMQSAAHLLQISNDVMGCAWLKKAGDLYFMAYHMEPALECYTKLLGDLAGIDGEEADLIFIETAIKFCQTTWGRHETARVLAILQEASERAVRSKKKAFLPLLKMNQATCEFLRSQYRLAMRLFEECWAEASTSEDTRLLRYAYLSRTFYHYWQGRFRDVLSNYESLVAEVDRFPRTRFPLYGVVFAGYSYCHTGNMSQGLGLLDALRRNCQERGDRHTECWTVGFLAAIMLDIRHTEDAFEHAHRAMEMAIDEHADMMLMFTQIQLALLFSLRNETEKAVDLLREFHQLSRKVQVTVWPYPYLMELSWELAQQDPKRFADLSIKGLVRRNIAGLNIFMKGIAYRFQARIQKQEGLPEDIIRNSLKLSLKWLEASGSELELARSQLEMARHYLSLGDEKQAAEFAQRASGKLSGYDKALVPDDLRLLLRKKPSLEKDIANELLRLGQDVVTIRDNREVVQHILTSVNQLTGAERGAIFTIDSQANPPRVELKASKNITPEQTTCPEFKGSMKIIERVARTRKGTILRADSDPGRRTFSGDRIRSCICIPMILKDQVVGVLYHDNRLLGNVFQESHLDQLTYFAALGAYALENASTYEEIKRLNRRLRQEKLYLEERQCDLPRPQNVVGKSPAITAVLNQISQVAKTDTTVLIQGETGVGKGLVAEALHKQSSRKDGPFICVQCSALPETLITSELFGHEKGAFTGAIERRSGRFELADGGTIFLDEIGEISLDLQVRLLRVLETKEFEHVGGAQTYRSDFRLVAATNRNLEDQVVAKRFRSDLYYRLNVFPLHVPPLRERKEDIPMLAHYFLGVHSRRLGKEFFEILSEEMDKLVDYDWPGNVRELQNVIERSTILSPESSFRVLEPGSRRSLSPPEGGVGHSLREMERRHILWALEQTGWKVQGPGGAAELLDMHRSTLQARMKKLGIKKPPVDKRNRIMTIRP